VVPRAAYGRLAWLAERTPALQWLSNLHVEKAVPVASPAKVLFGKVAVDTMLFQAPFLNLYFAVMGALEGLSVSEILEKTRASFHRAWALSFLVWTPVQAINLYFVPVPFQPTVVARAVPIEPTSAAAAAFSLFCSLLFSSVLFCGRDDSCAP
jgi:hypothetical protein